MKQLCTIFALLLLTACRDPRPTLHLFIWSEYIDPEVVTAFERQFSCRVAIDLYDDNESMLAKLSAGGAGLYDVVVPSDYAVTAMIQRHLLAPLDHKNIPNLKNIDPRFINPHFDSGNQFTVPYQWGTEGLFIRRSGNAPPDETWGLIFDRSRQPGPFLLMDDMRVCIGAALKYRGHSANSTNLAELAEARDLLLDAKNRSLGFENGLGGRNRVLSKGAVLAMVYSGDAVRALKEDPATYYFVPREGSGIWLDNLAIPSHAPRRDLAEKFINFILDANVGAQVSNFNRFSTPNQAAMPLINPADLDNPAIYPKPDVMARLEPTRDLGEQSKLYDELWTQIKSR